MLIFAFSYAKRAGAKQIKLKGKAAVKTAKQGGSKVRRQSASLAALGAGLLLSSVLAGCTTTGGNSDFGANGAALGGPVKPGQKPQSAVKGSRLAQSAALAGGRHYSAVGRASWYGAAFQGKKTANGEIFNMYKLTAAHRGLPLPSYVRVTNLQNGTSLIVRVNDRGPYAHNRLIDLSQQAAQLLDYHHGGLADVKVDYVGPAPAEGHDEAFLRASYRPAGLAPAAAETAIAAAEKPAAAGKTAEPGAEAEAKAKAGAPLSFKAEETADNALQGQPQTEAAQAAAAAAAPAADIKAAEAPTPALKPAEPDYLSAAEPMEWPQAAANDLPVLAAAQPAPRLLSALEAIKTGKAQLLSGGNAETFEPAAAAAK